MPIIMVHSIELMEEQKKILAREYTALFSKLTNLPPERVYLFFVDYPLNSVADGGVLAVDQPEEILDAWNFQATGPLAKQITVVSRMKAKPGMAEVAQQELLALLEATRDEPGCLGYDLYRGIDDLYQHTKQTDMFALQEVWQDQEAINYHLGTAHFQQFMGQVETLFDGAIEVTKKISNPVNSPLIDTTNKLHVLLRVKASPGKEKVIEHGMLEMMKLMRSHKGCLLCDTYQGFEGIYDPSVFIADQVWEDAEALAESKRYLDKHMPFYVEDLDGPREPISFVMVSRPPRITKRVTVADNAVLGDEALQENLWRLNENFADLCIRTSGEAYGQPLLNQRLKIFAAIVVDVVEQITGPAFKNHLLMAQQQGITREEIEELLLFLTVYVGFNKAGTFYPELDEFYG